MTNELLSTSLLKKQLPAYVNDTLGNVDFGPSLKTQSNDVVTVGNVTISVDALIERSSDDIEVKMLTGELVSAISKASPRNLYRYKNPGSLAKLWNRLTGAIDTKIIEFDLYCLRIETLSKHAPTVLSQLQESIKLIAALEKLYRKDIQLLDQYIAIGSEYLKEFDNGTNMHNCAIEHGLNRLRRKMINLKVTRCTLEMHAASVAMSLNASLNNCERFKDCVDGLLPMWQQQIRTLKSGVYDNKNDVETEKRFRALVCKIKKTEKGNR